MWLPFVSLYCVRVCVLCSCVSCVQVPKLNCESRRIVGAESVGKRLVGKVDRPFVSICNLIVCSLVPAL